MDIAQVFSGDSLKAADLQGGEPVVRIASVELKKFDDGNKLVISFEGKKKTLVCNKTNANRIAFAHGTDTDGWVGKEIQLYVDLVDFKGDTVEAIRIRPKKPAARASSADMTQNEVYSDQPAPRGKSQPDMDDEIPF
jgi:hypothetical protein